MTDLHPASEQFLTFTLADQLFGVSVLQVNDVLGPQKITRTPLSPSAIAGVMNLRGRIVTAVDVRSCLRQPARPADAAHKSVVVEQKGELFSLIIDEVGDVLSLSSDSFEPVPETLDATWRGVAAGIHKLHDRLLVVLDVATHHAPLVRGPGSLVVALLQQHPTPPVDRDDAGEPRHASPARSCSTRSTFAVN